MLEYNLVNFMTKFELDICLKVLKQFYITKELGNIIEPIYDEKNKTVAIEWIFPINLDSYLSSNYNIKKEIYNNTKYITKDVKSFLYLCHQIRNSVSEILNLHPIDALEYMFDSANKHIIQKKYFDIPNELWIQKIDKNNIYIKDNELRDILTQFDESVNPFINDKEIGNIFDVDVYSEMK